ncbi:MAG: S8 family serine peptidase [Planctomycetes bacterium]|nr:S8 family serine peptidase [Planctomycetota bacterium]
MRDFGYRGGLIALALAAGAGSACAALPGPLSKPSKHPTRILVRVSPLADRSAADAAFVEAGVRATVREFRLVPGLRVVEAGEERVEDVVARLRRLDSVEYAECDYPIEACAQEVPFGVAEVGAPAVWPRWGTGSGVIIGHLDTGVDMTHPDLPTPLAAATFVPGLTVDDYDFHGTHTAGILAGLDNDIGVIGIAPSAQLVVAKVLNNWEFGFNSYAIAGMEWAIAHGARVLNMSLGGNPFQQAFKDACDAALDQGVLMVASAGNLGSNAPFYPASFPSVMAVSAVDQTDVILPESCFGPHISLAGPGDTVYSAMPIVGWKITWNGVEHAANQLRGGTVDPFTGNAVYCGSGDSPAAFPAAVKNQVAHMRRGGISIGQQVQNAVNAGAKAVIISNNVPGGFTEPFNPHLRLPVASVSQADGDDLVAHDGVVVQIDQFNAGHTYGNVWGTSVSCPHVAGAAALLIGNFEPAPGLPRVPPLTIRWVLERTARQVGTGPRNDLYGWGIVDANNASKYMHGRIGCPGDLNADDLVDDADFVQFAAFYNDLLTPGGAYTGADFNGDAVSDDADFVVFASSYDALLCGG